MLNEAFDSLHVTRLCSNTPTAQQYEVFKLLRGRLDRQLATWKQIMSSDVPANPEPKEIEVKRGQRLDIHGVVVGVFHKPS